MIMGVQTKRGRAFKATRAKAHIGTPTRLQVAGFAPPFSPLGFQSWAERGVLSCHPHFSLIRKTLFIENLSSLKKKKKNKKVDKYNTRVVT